MIKKLAVSVVFLVVGGIISPLLTSYCHSQAFSPLAAEEAATHLLLDGSSVFEKGGDTNWNGFQGPAGLSDRHQMANSPRFVALIPPPPKHHSAVSARLFLLYHTFLFYDPA